MLGHFGALAPGDAFPKAKAAALRALEIDETFAGVHFSLGVVRLLYDWDFPGAEAEIQRGLQLAPNDANGHFAYGEWLTAMGRFEEAVVELERALDLDPLSSPIGANLASAYAFVRQYDRAFAQIRKTVELDPSFIAAQSLLAVLLSRAGYFEGAVAEVEKFLSDSSPEKRIHLIDDLINEITEEFQTTTVIVTHDMNSVMGIGDHIIFLHQGKKWWEGNNQTILDTNNKELLDFVYAANFLKKTNPNKNLK